MALIEEDLPPLVRRIEHIGGTAVPRMAAKDVIDLQVSVDDLDAVSQGRSPCSGVIPVEWRQRVLESFIRLGSPARRTGGCVQLSPAAT
jgi:GrpB-like predicted nucleotidyltransferase (UPF0157 family)